jgi:hypothetical protein
VFETFCQAQQEAKNNKLVWSFRPLAALTCVLAEMSAMFSRRQKLRWKAGWVAMKVVRPAAGQAFATYIATSPPQGAPV